MSALNSIVKRRAAGVVGACALLLGGLATAAVAGAGSADAATCATGTPCTITGGADLGGGVLNLTAPGSLGWTGVLNGLGQDLVDATATATGDQGYVVDDATGTGAGWHVTVAATPFTSTTVPADTLPNSGTFSTNGTVTETVTGGVVTAGGPADITPPDAACTTATDCTLPVDTAVSYPVAITTATAPTAVTVYDAAAASGLGSVTIGTFGAITATNPVGWWLHVPSSAATGIYDSTVTINIVSGPTP
jgi:hypothetical protein